MTKPDLRNALKAQSTPNPEPHKGRAPDAPAPKPRNRHHRPSRDGKVNLTGYYDPAVKYQLKRLSVTLSEKRSADVTLQDLLAEALNDLFAKHGLPEIVR